MDEAPAQMKVYVVGVRGTALHEGQKAGAKCPPTRDLPAELHTFREHLQPYHFAIGGTPHFGQTLAGCQCRRALVLFCPSASGILTMRSNATPSWL